ncbi:MAG: hypothetical protein ABI945_01005 [Nitrospirales bacterium]
MAETERRDGCPRIYVRLRREGWVGKSWGGKAVKCLFSSNGDNAVFDMVSATYYCAILTIAECCYARYGRSDAGMRVAEQIATLLGEFNRRCTYLSTVRFVFPIFMHSRLCYI